MTTKPVFTNGQTYVINHSRKGSFTVTVTHEDDEWVTGTIASGQPRFASQDSYAYAEKGESITLRKSLITNLPAARGEA